MFSGAHFCKEKFREEKSELIKSKLMHSTQNN